MSAIAKPSEQVVLRNSIVVTACLALIGIGFGLAAGSSAIVFDGFYSLTDASMTVLALVVSRLIVSSGMTGRPPGRFAQRFTVGFWHLEPMVLGLNGALLTGAAVFAFVSAVGDILAGGRDLAFGYGIAYAAITVAVALGMVAYVLRANRAIGSAFLTLDARAWMMSAGLTAALLVAFIVGALIQGTRYAWATPYVDPAVLIVVCVVILPIPLGTLRHAISDILLVTPPDILAEVTRVADEVVARHGFLSYRAYVARIGRAKQIELHFIVPENLPPRRLEEWDHLRNEIGEAIGGEGPDRWLTIAFTTDPEWAE
ncbi:cation diffusion facilitator family transporter [Aureimonas ureilytica]|uniref:cation diffusion facilitator family transporter n=1 Tax=Aureimonas ureilytica TaxID=401562 RepID=UPI0003A5DFA5|nr:cation transporter [Aureimonas ureilytica]